MTCTNVHMRADMNCGYAPAVAHTGGSTFAPSDRLGIGAPDLALTICPGFTTTLPEVIDVGVNFRHWKSAAIREVCPGGTPKPLLDGLNLLESAGDQRSSHRMKESAEEQRRKAGSGGG